MTKPLPPQKLKILKAMLGMTVAETKVANNQTFDDNGNNNGNNNNAGDKSGGGA